MNVWLVPSSGDACVMILVITFLGVIDMFLLDVDTKQLVLLLVLF